MIELNTRFDKKKSANLKLLQQVLQNLEWSPHVQIFIYSVIFGGWVWDDSFRVCGGFIYAFIIGN